MKLIKLIIGVIAVILALNFMGLLNPDFSKKVTDTSNYVKDKALKEWKDSPIVEAVQDELVKAVAESTTPVKFVKNADGSYSLKGEGLTGTYINKEPKSMEFSFNASNITSLKQAEALITMFKGSKYNFAQDKIKGQENVKIKIYKSGNGFKMESSIPGIS